MGGQMMLLNQAMSHILCIKAFFFIDKNFKHIDQIFNSG